MFRGRALLAVHERPGFLGKAMTCSGPQTYSRTIDFMAAHVAIVGLLLRRLSARGLPSVIGLEHCLRLAVEIGASSPRCEPRPRCCPQTTGASTAAMTSRPGLARSDAARADGGTLKGAGPARAAQASGPDRPSLEKRCSLVIVTSGLARFRMCSLLRHGPKVALGSCAPFPINLVRAAGGRDTATLDWDGEDSRGPRRRRRASPHLASVYRRRARQAGATRFKALISRVKAFATKNDRPPQ